MKGRTSSSTSLRSSPSGCSLLLPPGPQTSQQDPEIKTVNTDNHEAIRYKHIIGLDSGNTD